MPDWGSVSESSAGRELTISKDHLANIVPVKPAFPWHEAKTLRSNYLADGYAALYIRLKVVEAWDCMLKELGGASSWNNQARSKVQSQKQTGRAFLKKPTRPMIYPLSIFYLEMEADC